MTMLTHSGSEPASYRSGARNTAGTTIVDFVVLRRFWLRALGPLLTIGAVAGIIALKAAIFLSRVNY
jgi:hypothetical protein